MPRKNIFLIIKKKKKQEEIVNVNNDEEIFSDKISLHNDKYDDSINLDGVDYTIMIKINYYFWFICNILLLRYKFSSLNFISPLTKNIHMSPHIILSPHKYFPHITQIFSMILGSHKYFLYKAPQIAMCPLTNITCYIPRIIQLKFSTNKYSSYYYQNWAAKLHYPHTRPNII